MSGKTDKQTNKQKQNTNKQTKQTNKQKKPQEEPLEHGLFVLQYKQWDNLFLP